MVMVHVLRPEAQFSDILWDLLGVRQDVMMDGCDYRCMYMYSNTCQIQLQVQTRTARKCKHDHVVMHVFCLSAHTKFTRMCTQCQKVMNFLLLYVIISPVFFTTCFTVRLNCFNCCSLARFTFYNDRTKVPIPHSTTQCNTAT